MQKIGTASQRLTSSLPASLVLAALSLLACLASCNSIQPAPATQPATARQQELRQTVTYLASDQLEGRGLDTHGIQLASDYIAHRFAQAGLKPLANAKDYFQYFQLTTYDGLRDESVLRSGQTNWKPNVDFTAAPTVGSGEFSGPVVFAGYGIVSDDKEHPYDDYAGLDVKGKIVLIFRFEPVDAQGRSRFTAGSRSHHALFAEKLRVAAAHGAAAVLMFNPPNTDSPDAISNLNAGNLGGPSSIPFLQVKRSVGIELLQRGGIADAKAMQSSIDADFKPHSSLLDNVTITGKIIPLRKDRTLRNVIALLPGKGQDADQYIVVGAHYDHLGRGEPGSLSPYSHDIHHGADDNASGTAVVLQMAEELAQAARTRPPERSILFITFSGEERGLLGSQYFVSHPPIPMNQIVTMLNLDMVGRLRNEALDVGPSGMGDDIKTLLHDADAGLPLELKPMGKFNFAQWASDHASFAKDHVPVIFLFTGLHADYHRPTDTADKINYDGMRQVVDFSENLVRELCRYPADKLAQAEANVHPMMPGDVAHGGASLGVIPDYGSDAAVAGVLITGTSPGSGADIAGLKEGDRILALGDRKIENLEDLADALGQARPGDKVKIKIVRGSAELTLDATLGERR